MDRGNTKHGPQLDDALAREVRAHSPVGSRTRQWDEAEAASEELSPPTDEVTARSELGRWIPRSVLPGDRESLLRAVGETAPPHVIDQLESLPAGQTFETILELWGTLGHANETRR